MAQPTHSKFVVYVDESGDHSLQKVDAGYPVFVLAFCIFNHVYYSETVVPAVEKFKFRNFGHDIVILHEREIRKETGIFKFRDRALKKEFIYQLTDIIENINFILVASVIDKRNLKFPDGEPRNPYHMALGFCLETLFEFLKEKGQQDLTTHIVVEKRGEKEDRELELEFLRICSGANISGKSYPFEIVFADKKVNSAGLQLADLVARPIGLNYLRPDQENRAFNALKPKFFCRGGRANVGVEYEEWGLKIYPLSKSGKPSKSEKPR